MSPFTSTKSAPVSSASVDAAHGWSGADFERAIGLAEEEFARLAGGAGDEDVRDAVTVHVGGGEHRAGAVEAARQQALLEEFVVRPERVPRASGRAPRRSR